MNVVRCKNLHYFDGDRYPKCPHCGEGVGTEENKPEVKEEKKGFWGKGKKEKEQIVEDVKTEAAQFAKEESEKDSPTVDFWQSKPNADEQSAAAEKAEEKTEDKTEENAEEKVEEKIEIEKEPEQVEEPQISLKEAVKNASASNEGKTMSYFSSATAATSASAEKPANKIPSDPVVGWLVCTKGANFGECFSIFSGKNSIGRNTDNRIAITDDNSISRSKHAFIVYEPKKRNFYIQPGDSSGLTYLNDEYITETKLLSAKAVIELGESSFMFVPLCGQDFSWEDYI